MNTVGEYISDINNSLKALNIDDFIAPKFIYLKTQSIIADFLKKDNSSNKMIYKLSEGWTELPAIEMKEVPVNTVDVGVDLCQKLMKSVHKLPDFYETKFGGLLRQVTSQDYSHSYDPVFSPRLWKATQKREFKSKKYYFIIDGYLYIPIPKGEQSSPQVVRLEGYFKNLKEVEEFNLIQGCPDCNKTICNSHLDYPLVMPSYLANDIKKETLNLIANITKRINQDNLPNLNNLELTNRQ